MVPSGQLVDIDSRALVMAITSGGWAAEATTRTTIQFKDVGVDEVDGQEVVSTSGSNVEDLDTTLDGDDPVTLDHTASGLAVTSPQWCDILVWSPVVGDLQGTEERQNSVTSVARRHGESTTGYRPHSPHVPADTSCSDIIDYVQTQQMMDLVRDLTEDDDDVIHPTWLELQRPSNDGRRSDGRSTSPYGPAGRRNTTSTDGVSIQAAAVKQTINRSDSSKYTDNPNTGERSRGVNPNSSDRSGDNVESRLTTISHPVPKSVGFMMNENREVSSDRTSVKDESTSFPHLTLRTVGLEAVRSKRSDGANRHAPIAGNQFKDFLHLAPYTVVQEREQSNPNVRVGGVSTAFLQYNR